MRIMRRPWPDDMLGWMWWLAWERDYGRRDIGWKVLSIAVIKVHRAPQPGEDLTHGYHYRGVRFELNVWSPISVNRWR